ncbi:MAG TPA: hypothetical protein VGD48_01305 [Kutzneria sp.]|jgi:hypothetical protein
MRWRAIGVAAALLATASAAPPVAATTPHWQVTLLPMPAGPPNATAELQGSDGHGGYAGMVYRSGLPPAVATWHDGRIDVHEFPGDPLWDSTRVLGESRDDTVLVSSSPVHLTLDRAGVFHPVPTGSFTGVFAELIGPNGDLVGRAADPDDPSKFVVLYWPSPSAEPSLLAGMEGGSTVQAIDDDGTVLVNCACGIYLLHQGVARLLADPADGSVGQAYAITHGVVAGDGSDRAHAAGTGLVWRSPDSPQVQENSVRMLGVNSHGLSVGEVKANKDLKPVGVWQDGHSLGRLPAPNGYQTTTVRFVDEDGAIAGMVAAKPHEGDNLPAVWRFVQG